MADARADNSINTIQTRLDKSQVQEAERCFDMLPDGRTLTDAVNHLLRAWTEGEKPMALDDAILEHESAMKLDGLRKTTISGAKSKLKRFANETGFGSVRIDQISSDDILSWLNDLPSGSALQYRLAVSGLWTFAVDRKWCRNNIVIRDIVPKKQLKAAKNRDRGPIEILSNQQVRAILRAVSDDGVSLARWAVAIFAGLRPESEINRIDWENVDFEEKVIHIDESKVRHHFRKVRMSENLIEWLRMAKGQPFKLTRAQLKTGKRAAGYKSGLVRKEGSEDAIIDQGLPPMPPDICRHTYGSNFYAKTKSYNETSDQMGNSVRVLKEHYKRALTDSSVRAFWNIRPSNTLGEQKLKVVS
ncbi:MAG: hypothetical protein ACQKBT_09115 [Puniceicoccales bacterium]